MKKDPGDLKALGVGLRVCLPLEGGGPNGESGAGHWTTIPSCGSAPTHQVGDLTEFLNAWKSLLKKKNSRVEVLFKVFRKIRVGLITFPIRWRGGDTSQRRRERRKFVD